MRGMFPGTIARRNARIRAEEIPSVDQQRTGRPMNGRCFWNMNWLCLSTRDIRGSLAVSEARKGRWAGPRYFILYFSPGIVVGSWMFGERKQLRQTESFVLTFPCASMQDGTEQAPAEPRKGGS